MAAPVEERLRKRDRAIGWTLFGGFVLGLALLAILLVLAVPLIAIAFPLTLSAILVVLLIGWLRRRR